MHREQYGEYAYWCQVVFRTWFSFIHVSFRKATSVKKEESSKAKKSRTAISLDSGKEIVSHYWRYLYFLSEGWLVDFIFMGIMISKFFFHEFWLKMTILPFPSEQFFLYLNATHEWRIKIKKELNKMWVTNHFVSLMNFGLFERAKLVELTAL